MQHPDQNQYEQRLADIGRRMLQEISYQMPEKRSQSAVSNSYRQVPSPVQVVPTLIFPNIPYQSQKRRKEEQEIQELKRQNELLKAQSEFLQNQVKKPSSQHSNRKRVVESDDSSSSESSDDDRDSLIQEQKKQIESLSSQQPKVYYIQDPMVVQMKESMEQFQLLMEVQRRQNEEEKAEKQSRKLLKDRLARLEQELLGRKLEMQMNQQVNRASQELHAYYNNSLLQLNQAMLVMNRLQRVPQRPMYWPRN